MYLQVYVDNQPVSTGEQVVSMTASTILSGLSIEAIGVLTIALTDPERITGYRDLEGRGTGETTIRNAIRQLEQHGLRHRALVQEASNGEFKTVQFFSDTPVSQEYARTRVFSRIDGKDYRWVKGLSETPTDLPEWDRPGCATETSYCLAINRAEELISQQILHCSRSHRAVDYRGTVNQGLTKNSLSESLGKNVGNTSDSSIPSSRSTSSRQSRSSCLVEASRSTHLTGMGMKDEKGKEKEECTDSSQISAARKLLIDVIPKKFLEMNDDDCVVVAAHVQELLDAGITPKEIRSSMHGRFPEKLHSIRGIALYRLRACARRLADTPRDSRGRRLDPLCGISFEDQIITAEEMNDVARWTWIHDGHYVQMRHLNIDSIRESLSAAIRHGQAHPDTHPLAWAVACGLGWFLKPGWETKAQRVPLPA